MFDNLTQIIEVIETQWPSKHILVLGDVMVDKYVWGEVERISPEAPVPVVRASRRKDQPGGAANVAMNIAGLGARVSVLGFAGADADCDLLRSMLEAARVEDDLVCVPGLPTISKMRVLGGAQQMLRLDFEERRLPNGAAHDQLLQLLRKRMAIASALVLSDYGKGVLTPEVCKAAIAIARERGIPVLVDPKSADFSRYSGATTICPNLRELSAAASDGGGGLESLLAEAQNMVRRLDLDYLTVTLSEKGIAVVHPDNQFHAPAVARQVFDVSGAGDTVISVLALALSSGVAIHNAVRLANSAAGVVVGKVGTVPITKAELLASLSGEIALRPEEKILSGARLLGRVASWREMGYRVVFTNGCFDILHIGHIRLLEQARREGDKLIVAINSDAGVRTLKGGERPVVAQEDRAEILSALAAVDAVTIFDEPTPIELIRDIQPDVIVKGGDYREQDVIGAADVTTWGGKLVIVPITREVGTSGLIERSASALTDRRI